MKIVYTFIGFVSFWLFIGCLMVKMWFILFGWLKPYYLRTWIYALYKWYLDWYRFDYKNERFHFGLAIALWVRGMAIDGRGVFAFKPYGKWAIKMIDRHIATDYTYEEMQYPNTCIEERQPTHP